MCAVSNVYDLGKLVPAENWTIPAWDKFNKVVEAAKQLDQIKDAPDCEDPTKAEWVEEVEARLRKLEKHVAQLEFDFGE